MMGHSAATAHLPKEVSARVIAHRMSERGISVEAVEGVEGTYGIRSSVKGQGQEAAYEFALRMADRAFAGAEVLNERGPKHDEDVSWQVNILFNRTPEEATLDKRIFDTGSILSQAMLAKQRNRLVCDKGWLAQSLKEARWTLLELQRITGNPVMGSAAYLLVELHAETPKGAREAVRNGKPVGSPATWVRTRSIGRTAAAALVDMLDLGHGRLNQRPGHPGADVQDWKHLWLVRNYCLTALSLKEDRTLSHLGHPAVDNLSRALLTASAGLRGLSEAETGERSLLLFQGHRTMTRLISEIPFAQEGRHVPQPIHEQDAEDALLDATDSVLEIIEERFPSIAPSSHGHVNRPSGECVSQAFGR